MAIKTRLAKKHPPGSTSFEVRAYTDPNYDTDFDPDLFVGKSFQNLLDAKQWVRGLSNVSFADVIQRRWVEYLIDDDEYGKVVDVDYEDSADDDNLAEFYGGEWHDLS